MSDKGLEDELGATLAARKELGADYEDALVQSFLERVDREVDARLDSRIGPKPETGRVQQLGHRVRGVRGTRRGNPLVALGSVALGIPVTAIATSNLPGGDGLIATAIAWAAIAVVNIAHADRRE